MINVVNNPVCVHPKVVVCADSVTGAGNESVGLGDLPEVLRERNVASDVAQRVTYETRGLLSMTVVDMPGWAEGDADGEARALEAVKGAGEARTRVVLCVEEAGAWPSRTAGVVKRGGVVGCYGVYTEALARFRAVGTGAALTRYVAERPGNYVNHFFVALLPPGVAGGRDAAEYRSGALQAERLLRAGAGGLDRRFDAFVGTARLRAAVFDAVLAAYRQAAPAVRQGHKQLEDSVRGEIAAYERQIAALAPQKLRGFATNVGTAYLQFMESLLEGTVENLLASHHATFGETLEEECAPCCGGAWPGAGARAPPAEWAVAGQARRLLGRQQFERLLDEFRAVVAHTAMEPLTEDEIVVAGGAPAGGGPCCTQAAVAVACALARDRLDAQVRPLVRQFCCRIRYILRRLAETADGINRAIRKSALGQRGGSLLAQQQELCGSFAFFRTWVNGIYFDVLENALAQFAGLCDAEFLSGPVLAWDYCRRLPPDAAAQDGVPAVAQAVFDAARDRIAANVLLKCYDFFFDKNNIWARAVEELNEKIVDDILGELFEVEATEKKLAAKKKKVSKRLDGLVEEEKAVDRAAAELGAR